MEIVFTNNAVATLSRAEVMECVKAALKQKYPQVNFTNAKGDFKYTNGLSSTEIGSLVVSVDMPQTAVDSS